MNFDMSNHTNSGLLRFRSAPTSLLSNFTNGSVQKPTGDSIPNQGFSSRFSCNNNNGNLISQSFEEGKCNLVNGYSLIDSDLPPQYPRRNSNPIPNPNPATTFDDDDDIDTACYNNGVVGSMGLENSSKIGGGSSLLRQNSSPAGLFSHLTPPNGYAATRGIGNYRVGNGDLSPTSNRLNGQMKIAVSSSSTSLGMLPRISEIEADSVEQKLGSGDGGNLYAYDYPFGSWENDSSHFVDNFTGLKRELNDEADDGGGKLFAGSQNGEPGIERCLSHHLSLPNTSAEMAAMEKKFLHLRDSVPCKIRAKRGCATHPRSIAERVRRTRISERMRKLQELVPNMDKQTNTADMLDLAVDYIKDLQKQYKNLSDIRANCRCSSIQKLIPN